MWSEAVYPKYFLFRFSSTSIFWLVRVLIEILHFEEFLYVTPKICATLQPRESVGRRARVIVVAIVVVVVFFTLKDSPF